MSDTRTHYAKLVHDHDSKSQMHNMTKNSFGKLDHKNGHDGYISP